LGHNATAGWNKAGIKQATVQLWAREKQTELGSVAGLKVKKIQILGYIIETKDSNQSDFQIQTEV
jgi:hypothetical protein